jgi:predicted NUDIX family NTP pyrophosphohydrolase
VCREFKLPTGFSSDYNFCRDAARSRWLQANHRSPFARLHNIVPEWAAAFASDPKGLKAKREWKLGRPSGHFWSKKDEGAWTILKDLILAVEKPLGAARREFAEETGHRPRGRAVALGEARQRAAKLFTYGQLRMTGTPRNCAATRSKWSGYQSQGRQRFPNLTEAHLKILKRQAVFLDRLVEAFLEPAK